MIRDPSDGSVRESVAGIPTTKPVAGKSHPTEISGLPTGSTKPENVARLEKSREWLKRYRRAADDVNRMNDKGEIPAPEGGEDDAT